jgi:flagellar protein FliT
MSSSKQAFESLAGKLRDALAGGDWESIIALDEECRALVSTLRDEDGVDVGLREQLESLSRLYGELQQASRSERERLAGELTRLNQSKQASQAYKPLG